LNRLVHHVRSNAIAYLALFVALGGTSYAALTLPANSVGGRQIRNHSIDPIKLNPKYIAGSVRAWASVNSKGKIVASSGGAKIVASVGADQVTWPVKVFQTCAPLVTPESPNRPGATSSPAFGDASMIRVGKNKIGVLVSVFASEAQGPRPSRQQYVVAVVCPVPK